MTDTEKRIAEIKQRVAEAAPGPWRIYEEFDGYASGSEPPFCIARGMQGADGKGLNKGDDTECFNCADAEFMAHAREDVPFLLAQLAAEREMREKAEAERDKALAIAESAVSKMMVMEDDLDAERERAHRAEKEVKRLRVLLSDVFRRYDMDPCGCGECLECEVSDAIKEKP